MASVIVNLEWRLHCPACGAVIVTALGSKAAFDESTQIGALNVNEMRRFGCECGHRFPPSPVSPPIVRDHTFMVVVEWF